MSKAVKLADIGAKLGVSAVTVSKALSGQKGVSEEMRAKIVALADEMGYVRTTARIDRRDMRHYTIGVIMSEQFMDRGQSFYSSLYQELTRAAAQAGSYAIMELVSFENERRKFIPQVAYARKCDGVIVLGDFSRRYAHYLEDHVGIPMIYLDSNGRFDIHDCVVSNNMLGGYEMTSYLLNLGHSKIGFVGTRLVTTSIDDRFLGYYKALMERGIPLREDWIIDDREWTKNVDRYVETMRLPEDMPTAFFANCDMSATFFKQKLKEKEYRIPDDISLVGFDNFVVSGEDEFTTYEVEQSKMAKNAIHMIIRKIRDPQSEPGTLILPGRFIERNSAKRIGPPVPRI